MDLAATFSAMPNVRHLDALSHAWHWSRTPGWDFAPALTQAGEHVFQCFALNSYNEGLFALSFARKHADELIAPPERPLVVVEGFSHQEFAFDTVVAFGPAVHSYHEETPELWQAIRAVQPAYRCEFARDEPQSNAWSRCKRAAGGRPTTLNRDPRPYLKIRYKSDSGLIAERFFGKPPLANCYHSEKGSRPARDREGRISTVISKTRAAFLSMGPRVLASHITVNSERKGEVWRRENPKMMFAKN